jgi:hypothetical protein
LVGVDKPVLAAAPFHKVHARTRACCHNAPKEEEEEEAEEEEEEGGLDVKTKRKEKGKKGKTRKSVVKGVRHRPVQTP